MSAADQERENPRTTRVRQVILDAAIELLLDKGASEVTASRISEETRVARTTIYRQWPDQASLLLATIESLVSPHYPVPDTGELQADLRTTMTDLRHRLDTKQVRPVFGALADYSSRDDAFVTAQQTFVLGLMGPAIGVLEAAQARGELASTLDSPTAANVLMGPLLHQYLVMRSPISDELIDACLEQFTSTHLS